MPWIFNYSHLTIKEITKLLGNAPLCALPATLDSYRVTFKGHSRKWGGALATIEKKRKAVAYGSAYLLYDEEIEIYSKQFADYTPTTVKVTLTTGDIVKALTFINEGTEEEGIPGKDYTKEMTKHLRSFWDSGEGSSKLKLEDFIWTPAPKATPEKAEPEAPTTTTEEPKKRGRGRPRGSKNKSTATKE